MDIPCCFNSFGSVGISFQNHPMLVSAPPVPACSTAKSFSPLVAVSMGARKDDKDTDGGVLSTTQLMFRNMAALLYRSVPRKPKAEPAGSSLKCPPPDSSSDSDEDSEEGEEAEAEGAVLEELAEELECLEAVAIAGSREGREPGDYDPSAHLFDESSRVFQALKEREAGHHRHQEGS